MTTQILNEAIDLTEAQINTERRQIQGVVLIRAGMSKNKRFYSEDVLKTAAPIFEGSKAYVDHGKGARSMRDPSGYYTNVRYAEGKLMADRTFTRNAAGQDAWEIAQEVLSPGAPQNLAGLSINAVGSAKKREQDDALEIESITAAVSVDDVDNPAAGGGYKEGSEDELTRAFWEAVTFEEWRDSRRDYLDKMKNSWQDIKRGDELTAALAENETLKAQIQALEAFRAAKVETETLQAALTEAQTQLQASQTERDTALSERDSARRELGVERAMGKVSLPTAEWRKSLHEQLVAAPETQWAMLIESELSKAKAAGFKTPVSGASQQVNAPLPKPIVVQERETVIPIHMLHNPDELAAYMKARGYTT